MNTVNKLDKVGQQVRDLVRDSSYAIRVNAMWQRGRNPDLTRSLQHSDATEGFTVIRNSLHFDLIMALIRLHDSTKNTSSIPRVVETLSNSAVCNMLISDIEGPRPTARAKKDGLHAKRLLRKAAAEARHLQTDSTLTALKELRNRHLAHTATEKIDHKAKYGDESAILEISIAIVDKLAKVILGENCSWKKSSRIWSKHADAFWANIAERQAASLR